MENKKRYSGVLVKVKNKCLLCKRNNKGELPGEWSIPSGGIKKGESPVTAAIREFYEETNLQIESGLNLVGMLTRKTRDGKNAKGLLYVFLSEQELEQLPELDKAKDGSEHTKCDFFDKNNLPTPLGNDLKELISKFI